MLKDATITVNGSYINRKHAIVIQTSVAAALCHETDGITFIKSRNRASEYIVALNVSLTVTMLQYTYPN